MDDLYGDLDTSSSALTTSVTTATTVKLQAQIIALQNQVSTLQQANTDFAVQNATLEKNLCAVYDTAKSEMERKDLHITRLRQEMEQRK